MFVYNPFNGPYGFAGEEFSSLSMALGPEAAIPRSAASSGYYTEKPGHTVDLRLLTNPWTVDDEIADPPVKFVDNGAGEFSLTSRGTSDSESDYFDDDPKAVPYPEEKNVWATVDSFTSYREPTSDGDSIGNASGTDTSLTSLRYPFSVDTHPRAEAPSDARTQSLSSAARARSAPTLMRRHSVTGYNPLPNTFSWRSSDALQAWGAHEPAPAYTASPTSSYDGIEVGLDSLRLDEHPDFDPDDDPLPFRDDFPHYQESSYPTASQTWSSEQLLTPSAAAMGPVYLPVVPARTETYATPAPASWLQGATLTSSSLLHALSPSHMSSSTPQDGGPFLIERAQASSRTRASRKAPKASRGVDAAVVESRRLHPVLFHCSSCKIVGKPCDFTSKYSLKRHMDSTHRGFRAFCDYPGCQMTFRHTESRNRHVAKKHLQDHAEIGLMRARQRTRKKLPREAKTRCAKVKLGLAFQLRKERLDAGAGWCYE